jgi:hypothetical protein
LFWIPGIRPAKYRAKYYLASYVAPDGVDAHGGHKPRQIVSPIIRAERRERPPAWELVPSASQAHPKCPGPDHDDTR